MNRRLVSLVFVASLLAACATPPPFEPETPPPPAPPATPAAATFDATSLAGSVWVVEDLGGTRARAELQQRLQFVSASEVAGYGGCNSFTGTADISGDKVKFGPLGATQKACEGEAMAQEAFYYNALRATRSAVVENGRLLLKDDSGKTVVRLGRSQ